MFSRHPRRFVRAAQNVAALSATLLLFAGCSHGNSGSTQTDAQQSGAASVAPVAAAPDTAAAASSQPDAGAIAAASPDAASTDAAAATAAPAAAATPAAVAADTAAPDAAAAGSATCPLISSDAVAEVMHAKVVTVKVHTDPSSCDFTFQNTVTEALSIEYDPHGGPDEIKSARTGNSGAQAIIGGIINAATGNNSQQSQGMKNFVAATPPPDVAHVGDDQYFIVVGPVTKFLAVKGDGYVDVSGVVMADGLSRWQVLPELAKRVLASR